MGKEWEQQQLDKLVAKQQERIEQLKQQFLKEETEIAKSQVYNESQSEKKKTNSKQELGALNVCSTVRHNIQPR